eukprot:CAMPEP_0118936172 /NCGR_PEP_ID=MMETSP1169-20130426/16951_1 /TAXON_ID=36882 /ORGANISM="Pyramimonas obovata, Strain CCMP722" /LENGTH=375 /DNA_ID=CAMNT_0006879321 /DNA_START=315 /DNA_END=1442 /DNA_ORIENTATION=+
MGLGFLNVGRATHGWLGYAERRGFIVSMRKAFLGRDTCGAQVTTSGMRSRVVCSWEDTSAFVGVRRVRNQIVQLNRTNRNGRPSTVMIPENDKFDQNTHMEGLSCPSCPAELFEVIRQEALQDSKDEPALASFMYSTILSHKTLGAAIAFLLGNKLASPALLDTQIMMLFLQIFDTHEEVTRQMAADIVAVYDRDPACEKYSTPLLNFKGFQAIQAYRVTHCLWNQNRKALALALQSRISEVFHVDIHPAAKIGSGLLLDHATGVVIGETAVVGNNVSILHHVTLGGTGAEGKDRHPKIGDGALIGAGSTILGNIRIGNGVKIGAGSVVLTPIPDYETAVGVPARILKTKKLAQEPSINMDHTSFMSEIWDDYMI